MCLLIGSSLAYIFLPISINFNDEYVYGRGKIVYSTFEGGYFVIISDDDTSYYPRNLPPHFKIDGIRVEFIAKILKDWYSYYWAEIVELLFIRDFF